MNLMKAEGVVMEQESLRALAIQEDPVGSKPVAALKEVIHKAQDQAL